MFPFGVPFFLFKDYLSSHFDGGKRGEEERGGREGRKRGQEERGRWGEGGRVRGGKERGTEQGWQQGEVYRNGAGHERTRKGG